MRSSLLSRSTVLKALVCLLAACTPRTVPLQMELPAAAPVAPADGWLFLGSRAAGEWSDPRLALVVPEWTAAPGDRLEWWMVDDEARAQRAGIELAWSDGLRSMAPLVDDQAGPRRLTIALDAHAGQRLVGAEVVVRGMPVGCARLEFGAARLVAAAGGEAALVPPSSGVQSLRRGNSQAAAIQSSLARERRESLARLATETVVGEPWIPLSLAARRAGAGAEPDDLCAVGDGVPMRVAPAGESLAAAGERFDFSPLDGARTYELWLCVEAPAAPFDCELVVVGREGERRGASLRVDAAAEGVLPLGDGRILLRRPLAAAYPIRGLELPQDARLRLQGLSARRLVSGFLDTRFVEAWTRDEVRGAGWIDAATREALEGWGRMRTTGSVFLDLPEEAGTLQQLSQSLLARDPAALRAVAEQRVAALAALAGGLDALEVQVCAVPAPGADLAGVLRACGTHGIALRGVGAADLQGLPDESLAAARGMIADGRLQLDALRPHGVRSPLSPLPLLRGLDLLRAARAAVAPGTDDPSPLALYDEPCGAHPALPTLCAAAGTRQLLARGAAAGEPGTNMRWRAADGADVMLATPHLDVQGALTLDPSFWRAWTAAHRAQPTTALLVCELGGAGDEATLDAIGRWRACPLAPRLVSGPLDSALASMRRIEASAPVAAAPAGADVAERRAAERAAAEAELVAALAAQHGARAQVEPAARLWRRFQPHLADAQALWRDALAVRGAAMEALARLVDTHGAGVPVVALNTLPFERAALLEFAGAVTVSDETGRPLVLQRGRDGGTLARVELPALGHAVVRVAAAEPQAQAPASMRNELSNDRLRARLSRDGRLQSLVDATDGRELLAQPVALLDGGVWSLVESGPLRTSLELRASTPAGEARIEASLAAGEAALRLVCDLPAPRRLGLALTAGCDRIEAGVPGGFAAESAAAGAVVPFDEWISLGDGTRGLALATRAVSAARVLPLDGGARALVVDLPAGRSELALLPHAGGARRSGIPQACEAILTAPLLRAVPARASGVPARMDALALRRGAAGGREAGVLAPLVRAVADGAGLELALVETSGAGGEVDLRPLLPHRELLRVDAGGAVLDTPAVRDGAWPLLLRPGGIELVRIVR